MGDFCFFLVIINLVFFGEVDIERFKVFNWGFLIFEGWGWVSF